MGWALGDGREHGDDPAWDARGAEALYGLLEQQVVPGFYDREANGLPPAWCTRMRRSMAELTPRYSSNRAVREYTERYYLPAAQAYRLRSAERGASGQRLVAWRRQLDRQWPGVRFDGVQAGAQDGSHAFEVRVQLNGLAPSAVEVTLYAEGLAGAPPSCVAMEHAQTEAGPPETAVYRAVVPASRPSGDYTARITPRGEGLSVTLECPRILWQR